MRDEQLMRHNTETSRGKAGDYPRTAGSAHSSGDAEIGLPQGGILPLGKEEHIWVADVPSRMLWAMDRQAQTSALGD